MEQATVKADYREIRLTRGQVALVDPEDFERLNAHKWHAHWDGKMRSFYAARWSPMVKGKRGKMILMAREVLNARSGMDVDHKFHQTLDNRKSELRQATRAENLQNQHRSRDNKCGLKGVSRDGRTGKYTAFIRTGGKQVYLGIYATSEDAHAAYCKAAGTLFGEFACTG